MTEREEVFEVEGSVAGGQYMNKAYNTCTPKFTIHFAQVGDISLILRFIERLAEYEGLSEEVVATEDVLLDSLFVKKQAEVIIGELDGKPVAFALFFHNFSTFMGKANLYLEDLFVDERCRGQGLGRSMFAFLARSRWNATVRDSTGGV